jgi:hypothetical protein
MIAYVYVNFFAIMSIILDTHLLKKIYVHEVKH